MRLASNGKWRESPSALTNTEGMIQCSHPSQCLSDSVALLLRLVASIQVRL
jgi:hypothetical protein